MKTFLEEQIIWAQKIIQKCEKRKNVNGLRGFRLLHSWLFTRLCFLKKTQTHRGSSAAYKVTHYPRNSTVIKDLFVWNAPETRT